MPHSTQLENERVATLTPENQVGVRVVRRHHLLVRLATHVNGKPLTVEHGAPLRLLAPVKLGLKNVKATTRITYSAELPKDYWAERGYSFYDGI